MQKTLYQKNGGKSMDYNNNIYDIRFVALYLRKSRAESVKDLEKHKMILIDLCHKNNFKYLIYEEIGTSDSIELRPKITKLLNEVQEGVFDAVCVVDYDRLSRGDMGDQDRILKVFKKSETLIITPDRIYDLNNDSDDEMVEFKGFFARREYKMITKRLRQGKKIGSRQGQWTNGIPPFPYAYQTYKDKFNKKGLVVNDERLPLYREIIEMYLQGISTQKIAVSLNTRGLLTQRGNFWSNTAITRLLIDETHLGKIISNKTQGDGHKNKRPNAKAAKILPKSEWVIIENCHEAVKTPEEHESIISLINSKQKIPFKSRKQTYSLTGIIKCAKCGHSHSIHTINKNKVYIKPCWYKNEFGIKCRNLGVYSDTLEKLILGEISKYKEKFLNCSFENEGLLYDRLKNSLNEKNSLLEKYQKALNTANDSYELGDYGRDEWIKRKEKWNSSIEYVTSEIYELKKQLQATQQKTNEERHENLIYFFDNITTAIDGNERNTLYKTIIDSIIFQREGNNININIIFK